MVLIQEYLSSKTKKTIEIMGEVLKDGTIVLPSPIVKIREYPYYNGSTSYAKFDNALSEERMKALNRLIEMIGLYGLFDIELINNDQKAYFIEINVRNGAPSYALTLAGANLPYIWYEDAIGGGES